MGIKIFAQWIAQVIDRESTENRNESRENHYGRTTHLHIDLTTRAEALAQYKEDIMDKKQLGQEIGATSYPGRGIVVGKTPDGKKATIAYFIMGR